jgi:hypothetical protein
MLINKEKGDFLALDVFVISVLPFIAFLATQLLHLTYIPSMVLFFVIPSIYLSLRKPEIVKKSFIFTAIFFLPLTFICDYLIFVDNGWFVPSNIRFLRGAIPLEDVIWAFFWVYYAIVFWEYFLDLHKVHEKLSRNMKYLIVFLSILTVGFFSFYFLKPDFLIEPYAYIKLSILFIIIPMILVLSKFHHLWRKILIIGIYFLILSALYDVSAVSQGQWWFTGANYLGTTKILGQIFPWDEIIFWWFLGVPAIIVWYEFFDDDRK